MERLLLEGKKGSITEIKKYGETFVEGARSLEDDPIALCQDCQTK